MAHTDRDNRPATHISRKWAVDEFKHLQQDEIVFGKEFEHKKGSFALIFRRNEQQILEVLLVHRQDLDLWNLPGGAMDDDETLREGVVREVKEETGLDVVSLGTIACIYAPPLNKINPIGSEKREDLYGVSVCYVVGGEIELTDEARAISWFSADRFPENLFEKHREAILMVMNDELGKEAIELALREHKVHL